jgi:hypothetical protein
MSEKATPVLKSSLSAAGRAGSCKIVAVVSNGNIDLDEFAQLIGQA